MITNTNCTSYLAAFPAGVCPCFDISFVTVMPLECGHGFCSLRRPTHPIRTPSIASTGLARRLCKQCSFWPGQTTAQESTQTVLHLQLVHGVMLQLDLSNTYSAPDPDARHARVIEVRPVHESKTPGENTLWSIRMEDHRPTENDSTRGTEARTSHKPDHYGRILGGAFGLRGLLVGVGFHGTY